MKSYSLRERRNILERGSVMEKEEVRASLTELIGEVMPELEDISMEKNIISEYGINSVSIINHLLYNK